LSDRAQEILLLCEQWLQSGGDDRYRLLNNGIVFHQLTYEELRAACLGLTRRLLLPGRNTIIDDDHRFFWSWTGELLAGARPVFVTDQELELQRLTRLVFHASLASRTPTGDSHARALIEDQHIVLAYLGFPLLEAFLKKKCAKFIDLNGTVLQPFEVRGKRRYVPGKRCSSTRDLLWLLYDTVAEPQLIDGLDTLCRHVSQFGTDHPFNIFYTWRNSSLHGSTLLPTIGGTVLNTSILIALDSIQNSYGTIRADVEARTSFFAGIGDSRASWSFYPPL
jgi:hypothetical protein